MPTSPSIKDTAETARDSLDDAKQYLSKVRRAHKGEKDVVEKLEKQDQELTNTRELLTRLMFQNALQLPSLADPLAQVKKTVEKLVTVLAEGKQESLGKVANAVGDVRQATINLRGQIPGDYIEATGLVAEKAAVQLMGPVIENYKYEGQKLTAIAKDNTAKEGAFQLGSLFAGPAEVLVKLQEGAGRRREEQKGEVRITK